MTVPPNRTNPQDEFGSHMPFYQRGRAWYIASLAAALANNDEQRQLAEDAYYESERLIGLFGEEDDPENFRDFIAGALRQAREFLWVDGDDDPMAADAAVIRLVPNPKEGHS